MASDLSRTHPEFVDRLETMLALPDFKNVGVGFTWRTYETQKRLYDGWKAGKPGYNMAANPDRVIGTTEEGWKAVGSWHMIQADGYSHAVDLDRPSWMSHAHLKKIVDTAGPPLGIRRTVPSESWHVQARSLSWFPVEAAAPGPPIPEPETKEYDMIHICADTTTGEKWVCENGTALKLTNPSAWTGHTLPRAESPSMRYAIQKLYRIVT